jgi:hypothetical protein
MRLMRTFFGVITCSCLALTPAFAGQRGQHPTPTPAAVAPPAHPANSEAHPAPVPVPQKIAANPALVTRLQPLLPSGMTLASAATGFKNQGQFIGALHVSRNLNIPFAQLKAEMTGADHDSLGQAIHQLQPTVNAKAAVKTAEREAAADLKAMKPAKTDTGKDGR